MIIGIFLTVLYLYIYYEVVCTRVNDPPKDLLQVVKPHSYAGFRHKKYRYAKTNFKFVQCTGGLTPQDH